MHKPILATKLFIPPTLPNLVPRPHLIERLNEGLARGCKLTLISAPAGFGKTTLISEWVTKDNGPVAWLSLDERDNDLVGFLTYFIAALQTTVANIGAGALVVLQSHQPPSPESILTTLVNEITTVQENFILVLDDYHLIDSKPVDEALTFLLEHLPPQMHMVITTREDPTLPLSRYRVRGQLTELRANDLRFTPEEAGLFLNQMMNLNLSVENIAALETRTEGWIAGLQLAALSMQGHSDKAGFVKAFTGSHRFVLDYLVEEVLQRQTEKVRSFLLETSILDRICAPLSNAVTGRGDGKDLLDILDRGNLFLNSLDEQRKWYRYHPLFAEVLRARLMDEQPDKAVRLHQRASNWFENNGSAPDAIHHALAAKDFDHAAFLIELAVPEMRRNRQGATVTELGWIKALPEDLIRFRPVLSVAYAYALFGSGELEDVDTWLGYAEQWLEKMAEIHETQGLPRPVKVDGMIIVDENEFTRLPGMIALLRTAQALARGDMVATVKNAQQVLQVALDNDYLLIGGAASTLGLAVWSNGDLETARRMITDGMENVRRAGYISAAIGNANTLGDIQIVQGCLQEAMATYEQALGWAMAPGKPTLRGAADMYVGMSTIYREYNDLKNATEYLLKSRSLGELAGLPQNPYRWCAAMARIREAQGDLNGALDLLGQAEHLYDANFSPNVRPLATRKARLWLAQGRLSEVMRWVNQQGLSVDNELSYLREFDHLTLVRVLLTRYRNERSAAAMSDLLKFLEGLLKAAQKGGRKGSVIEILVQQAIANQAQNNLPDALLSLQKALMLAETEGYTRIFLDEGPDMMQLLHETAKRGIMPDYSGKLLTAFEFEKTRYVEKSDSPLEPSLIDPLSQRELEVLKLLRSDLSGPEIAQLLSVSINTFRTHTKNIFIKLGVNDRRAAIRRAEELELL